MLKPNLQNYANQLPKQQNDIYVFIYDKKRDINGNTRIKARFFIIEMENGKPELVDYTKTISGLSLDSKLIDNKTSSTVFYSAQFNSIRVLEYELNRHLKDLKINKEITLTII